MRMVSEIGIDDLLGSQAADPDAHLDPDRVEHYVEAGDDVEPVVVFDTGEGLLLVDGYHRVAAAKLRGATSIAAEVRHGTRRDALRYAVERGAAERGISTRAARAQIRKHSHRRWGAAPED